jgi:hypothetical protein
MNNNRMPEIILKYWPNGRGQLKRLLYEADTGLLRPNSWRMMIMMNLPMKCLSFKAYKYIITRKSIYIEPLAINFELKSLTLRLHRLHYWSRHSSYFLVNKHVWDTNVSLPSSCIGRWNLSLCPHQDHFTSSQHLGYSIWKQA